MASNNNTTISLVPGYTQDHNISPNTTFVQADPSNFRAVVQKLTGASESSSSQKFPVTFSTRNTTKHPQAANGAEMGPRRPAFKLHERRQRKLEIKLNNNNNMWNSAVSNDDHQHGFASSPSGQTCLSWQRGGFVMVSPVSTLDLFARGSPRTPHEEEEKAIAEKKFYLHPSTPRGSAETPELLPLFPLQSPRDNNNNNNE